MFLSTDALVSVLISSSALILALSGFFLQLDSLSHQYAFIDVQRKAMVIADKLVFSCEEGPGLAKCRGTEPDSNVLSKSAIHSFMHLPLTDIKRNFHLVESSRIRISLETDGRSLLTVGDLDPDGGNGKACIKRLGMADDEAVVLSVCIG